MGGIGVRSLTSDDAEACDRVVGSLPYQFGDPIGLAECAKSVRSDRGLVALDEGSVVGFLTWRSWFEVAYEIAWMAVQSDRRGAGIGSLLVERLATLASEESMKFLFVTTLSASAPELGVADGYERTRAFYRARGFLSLWEPAGWWADDNQAVLMVRPLNC
jgi:GNAT superfamily N-acetyltransferase